MAESGKSQEARNYLDDFVQLRAVAELMSTGISADHLSRLARWAHACSDGSVETPTELIALDAVGTLTEDELTDWLLATGLTSGQHDPTCGNGYRRGIWDDVQDAVDRGWLAGWLSDATYERLVQNYAESGSPKQRA